MITFVIALMAASPLVQSAAPFERITPEVAAKRVSDCGFGRVKIRHDELLQSDILAATGDDNVTDEQLSCADEAASFYDLELPPGLQARYGAIRTKRLSGIFVAEAKAWLAARGMLERVPPYQPGASNDADFARDIERLCGPLAEGAFQSQYGSHAISPDWVKRRLVSPKMEGSQALACILNVTTVAGFEVGLIGNESFAEGQSAKP